MATTPQSNKRRSMGQVNTLLNYFSSPKGDSKMQITPKKNESEEKVVSNNTIEEPMENDDDEQIQTQKKRRRIITSSSDSDESSDRENNSTTPVRKAKKGKLADTPRPSPSKSKISALNDEDHTSHKESKNEDIPDADMPKRFLHTRLEFLMPSKIRDGNKRRPDDPEYDFRTLHVPDSFLVSLTPAMRQWWELKSKHMDSILFFKVGKFYELYHMDAAEGVNHLGLTYMKGDFAHSGFPEQAYNKMASGLIAKGFKVARVEQTETPELMAERCKKMSKVTKFDKVVAREICQISMIGTCIYTAQMPEASTPMSTYMYALCDKPGTEGVAVRIGACFIDTSTSAVYLAEFDDDKYCSKLLALFSERTPALILTERGSSASLLMKLLSVHFKDIRKETLASKTQFFAARTTLENLQSSCYFRDKTDKFEWPAVFKEVAENMVPKPEFELALRCLGACIWYLRDSLLDIQVFSMKKFEIYTPADLSSCHKEKDERTERDCMILDSNTMQNLNLLGSKGTLQETLDYCVTPFGKRLFLQWICRPLCNIDRITERQKAVKELCDNPSLLTATQNLLKKLPDFEREVAKIHIYGNRFCANDHPDGRAIFYEAKTYSKRKIADLLKTLKGFELSQDLAAFFKSSDSKLLRKLTLFAPDGVNVDLTETIDFFKNAFDHKLAETEGRIIPNPGAEESYDEAIAAIDQINKKLDKYINEQRKATGYRMTYFGSDKKRFQLEIPEADCGKKIPKGYYMEGGRKGYQRFTTDTTKELLAEMLKAEDHRAKIILDLNRKIFEKFSDRYNDWKKVTHCVAILDVLCSLAKYGTTTVDDICMPEILPFSNEPILDIENGRYPSLHSNFVPNDLILGKSTNPSILILTGPNMGGKSTLMRQAGLITIMAQIGSFVPATSCRLSLTDRIFTRLGTYDDLEHGQSTFLMELCEASCILRHATLQSLVLVDELGRGTSTQDGNAIATAFLRKLCQKRFRTIFSTHYHNLVQYFVGCQDVQLGHMACIVENEDEPSMESVTFLYKMVPGTSPKSYGFNAARLAGLKESLVLEARRKAKKTEESSKRIAVIKGFFLYGKLSFDGLKACSTT